MDGNKDEAVKCMNIGYKALKDGDKARAYKFLSKASRLDPSLPVKDLFSSMSEEIEREKADCSTSTRENEQDADKSKGRNAAGSDATTNGCHKADAPSFSSEQIEVVRRIKKTKDYYQMLGLNKDCTSEEVRKAYRKLSLKVHPDKNQAPGAEEAFKAVSKAFVCLSDEEKRKKYDQFGLEEHEVAEQHYARRYRSNGFYEDAFDADEIFNSFFFGSSYPNSAFHRRAHFVRTRTTAGQGMGGGGVRTQEVQFGNFFHLLQLLPVLVLILISIFPFSRPVYNLEQVAPYNYQHFTKNKVPYFVKSQNFDKDYPPGSPYRGNIEAQVDRDYREILAYNCRLELGRRNWNPSLRTPHCDRLKEIKVY